jgi:NADH:ubiquinone oxidoreductase subunit
VRAELTPTGTDRAYQPKGAWADADKRNWLKYSAWRPPGAAGAAAGRGGKA